MTTQTIAGRWWENYLVRYFMPSIAGIAIVAWLITIGPINLRETLFFGKPPASLDAPTLTLLVLYGNLFCYVASYPILCFHATRVIDFKQYSWQPRLTDGYVATSILGLLILATTVIFSGWWRVVTLFTLVLLFSLVQLIRVRASLARPAIQGYQTRPTPLLYAFLVSLAKRRGVVSEKKTTTTSGADATAEEDTGTNEKITEEQETRWKMELVESYRHMREHGNSAFIFLLELILAAACYGVMTLPQAKAPETLSIIAALLAFWSVPAAFVHLLGQQLERRYALFDGKLDASKVSAPSINTDAGDKAAGAGYVKRGAAAI